MNLKETGWKATVKEVVACDHVVVDYLADRRVPNFSVRGPGYIVIEESKIKVICPSCLLRSTPISVS